MVKRADELFLFTDIKRFDTEDVSGQIPTRVEIEGSGWHFVASSMKFFSSQESGIIQVYFFRRVKLLYYTRDANLLNGEDSRLEKIFETPSSMVFVNSELVRKSSEVNHLRDIQNAF